MWSREGDNRIQRAAMNHALYAWGHHCRWFAFLDLDEFMVLPSVLAVPHTLPRTAAETPPVEARMADHDFFLLVSSLLLLRASRFAWRRALQDPSPSTIEPVSPRVKFPRIVQLSSGPVRY